jgi:hypothetical protein
VAKKTTEPPSGGWILDDLLPQLADYYDHYRRSLHAGRANRELEAVREELAGVFRRDEYTDHFPKIAYKSYGLNAVMAVWPRDNTLAEYHVNIAYSNPSTGSESLPYPAFEMFSISLKDNAIASAGLRRLTLNDSILDASFMVWGAEEYPIRKLMDRKARESILSIYSMLPHRSFYMGLEYDRVLVKKVVPAPMLSAAFLRDYNDQSRRMIDGFLATLTVEGADAEMIEVLEVVLPEEIGRCQVCGERIILDKIECRRCDTPHHRDCWDYNGKCAMYACGETKYRNITT